MEVFVEQADFLDQRKPTFRRYTGQENQNERDPIRQSNRTFSAFAGHGDGCTDARRCLAG